MYYTVNHKKVGSRVHLLLHTYTHIYLPGWQLTVIIGELTALSLLARALVNNILANFELPYAIHGW